MDAPDRIWLDRFYTEEITGGHFRCTRYRMNTGAGGDIEYVQASAVKAEANAPADPALLALAKLGAALVRGWFMGRSGFKSVGADSVSLVADESGVVALSLLTGYTLAPGIADAIAALLAPDGAASEGVAG